MNSVLLIMDYAAPYKGNFINSIQYLESFTNKLEYRLVYLFPEKARNLDWIHNLKTTGAHIYFIDNFFFSKKVKFKNIKFLRDLVKKENISILHTHFMAYNYSLCLMKLFFTRGIFIIGHFHNTFQPPDNMLKKIRVIIVKLTYDLIIGVSEAVKESLVKEGISPQKTIAIKNAIDFSRLDGFEKFTIANDPGQKVVFMLGWPFHRKGVDIVLNAIKQLISDGKDILLAISLAGENELFEGEIIKTIGSIPSWVKILGPRNDLATYYNAADIFLSASREEGFSYALVEGAYCKPLLISSDIPAPVSLKIPNMFTYPVEDSTRLQNLISKLLELPAEQIEKIKMEQKLYVKETFYLSRWAGEIFLCYQRINSKLR